jgi:hypothetical protein
MAAGPEFASSTGKAQIGFDGREAADPRAFVRVEDL